MPFSLPSENGISQASANRYSLRAWADSRDVKGEQVRLPFARLS
jgi:hypothetical protein